MASNQDLRVVLRSRTPIVVVETHDEPELLNMLVQNSMSVNVTDHLPMFRWSITDGLQRLDISLEEQESTFEPEDVLRSIRKTRQQGIYVLLDFHPYLQDPLNTRLLKDIAIDSAALQRKVVLLSHRIKLPPELEHFSVQFDMQLPDEKERALIIREVADEWAAENPGSAVQADAKAYRMLVTNLAGLTTSDTRRLARNAIMQDGAITKSDLPPVMEAKYQLLNRDGVLSYEYDTSRFSQIGGQMKLKEWLKFREPAFRGELKHLDAPKGALLLGVQGCGKSLAARAVAGVYAVPLLRLDFGRLFNKYHGETEKNLRGALEMATLMAPCVLWVDEIEKSLASGNDNSGTAKRVLGTFLTWLAEKKNPVFIVATANDVSELPPELVRKGRFDEVFFVDLPKFEIRKRIFEIHLVKRDLDVSQFDLNLLAKETDGFSGSEIEQAVVSGMYAAHAHDQTLNQAVLMDEIRRTFPLSVTMSEKIEKLRAWATSRAVSVD